MVFKAPNPLRDGSPVSGSTLRGPVLWADSKPVNLYPLKEPRSADFPPEKKPRLIRDKLERSQATNPSV